MRNAKRETEDEERSCQKWDEKEETQTHRLRAPIGAPGETGVKRPDGRKPEAGEGTGPGSGGVTGNPVAGSERERHGEACERNCVKFGFLLG